MSTVYRKRSDGSGTEELIPTAGVTGNIFPDDWSSRGSLLAAIRAALARDAAQSATAERLVELRTRYASLTPRERQVLGGIVAGKLNKTIADELAISVKTVEAHRAKVMEKTRANSVAELVQIALDAQDRTTPHSGRS